MAVRRYIRDRKGRFSATGGTVASRNKPKAPSKPGGAITKKLRKGQRALYKSEQDRLHALGGDVAGMRIIQRNVRQGAAARPTSSASGANRSGSASGALQGALRQLAQSDARYFRGAQQALGGNRQSSKIKGTSSKRLPGKK
jgi:hypothetical protein